MKAEFASVNNVEGVVSKLTEWSSNSYRLDRFAEVVGQCLEGSVSKPSETTVTDNGDGTYTYRILGLDPGYYMIKDTTETVNGEDFETKYLLYLTTHIDLITKGDYSTVTKTVNDTIDGTYYDSIAEQLNKTYFYKWEIELDDEMAWYNTYKLECYDELSAGLDFGKYEEVYIEEADNDKVYLYKENNWLSSDAAPTTNSKTETSDGKTKLVLGWANLKTAYPDVAGDDKLVVKYSATLNENAVFGVEGNPNEVYIVFSNSPSDADDGQSESDDAVAFSFQLKILKVDADKLDKPLEDAQFYLYHKHGSEVHYAVLDTIKTDGVNKIVEWTTDKSQATLLVTGADGLIEGGNLQGLKDGTIYYLHEEVPPVGYNKMFTDVEITIHPNFITDATGKITYDRITYNVDGVESVLTDGEEFTHGIITATVLNDKGTTLPSTGGIGTTIFYVLGGVLAVAAVVLLITKKRMSTEE